MFGIVVVVRPARKVHAVNASIFINHVFQIFLTCNGNYLFQIPGPPNHPLLDDDDAFQVRNEITDVLIIFFAYYLYCSW